MAILRTAMIDDDGSGTTGTILNNAWKQELYGQIDAALLTLGPPLTPFTPVDGSGAGLVFVAGTTSGYIRVNSLLFVQMHVTYPTTASGTLSGIGGLPYPAASGGGHGGFVQGYGPLGVRFWLPAGSDVIQVLSGTTGGNLANATLSGVNLTLHGFYFI